MTINALIIYETIRWAFPNYRQETQFSFDVITCNTKLEPFFKTEILTSKNSFHLVQWKIAEGQVSGYLILINPENILELVCE